MTFSQPTVTVVTPSLNQGRFIRHAIESVLSQDYPNLEYIVVDGASTDRTVEILESYGDRLQFVSERDSGQSHAINKGLRMARGEVVAWLNSDDVILPGAVRKAAEALALDPGLGMVHGEGYRIDEEGRTLSRFQYTEPFNLWRLIYFGDTVLQQTAFMRKSAVEAVGYLDESLHWGMDWDLFIRLGKRFRVQYLSEYMGCIREYGETKTTTGGLERLRELARIIRTHAGRQWIPSYFGYGLDTYYRIVTRLIQHELPERLRPMSIASLDRLHAFLSRRIFFAMETCQGWFDDGWASPRVHLLCPQFPGPATLEIQGQLPETESQKNQSLTVIVSGKRLVSRSLTAGSFRLVQPLPDWARDEPVLEMELRASRILRRRRDRRFGCKQALSYLLDRVTVSDSSGEVSWGPPRALF